MFNSYDFTYAGESSLLYGLNIYDISGFSQDNVAFGNKASIVETRLPNRITPIHFGVNYNMAPLEFNLVFGAQKALDRYDLEVISYWLLGKQDYQWLTIDQPDLADVEFRCLITELTPISIGWIPYAFQAHVICDCPYAYSHEFEWEIPINGADMVYVNNDSTVHEYIKPTITFTRVDNTDPVCQITNRSDNNRLCKLSPLPSTALQVYIDNENGILVDQTSGTNLYENFNMNFFRLVPGENQLYMRGTGTYVIKGRFYRNVAG